MGLLQPAPDFAKRPTFTWAQPSSQRLSTTYPNNIEISNFYRTVGLIILCSQVLCDVKVPFPFYTKEKGFHARKSPIFRLFPVSCLRSCSLVITLLHWNILWYTSGKGRERGGGVVQHRRNYMILWEIYNRFVNPYSKLVLLLFLFLLRKLILHFRLW